MKNHASTHRIELDVPVAGKDVLLGLRQAGTEATFPERAAAAIDAVDVLDVALTQMLHQKRCAAAGLGSQQQMNVIGHQHIGVDSAAKAVGEFS
jgi:hypothetical protein